MIHNNSTRKFKRSLGQCRKDVSIYTKLGRPYDIENKPVEFIGPGEHYALTKGKQYIILDTNNGKSCYDKQLSDRCKNMPHKIYKASQSEDYFLTIINDKGHKKKYSHLMFKKVEGVRYDK